MRRTISLLSFFLLFFFLTYPSLLSPVFYTFSHHSSLTCPRLQHFYLTFILCLLFLPSLPSPPLSSPLFNRFCLFLTFTLFSHPNSFTFFFCYFASFVCSTCFLHVLSLSLPPVSFGHPVSFSSLSSSSHYSPPPLFPLLIHPTVPLIHPNMPPLPPLSSSSSSISSNFSFSFSFTYSSLFFITTSPCYPLSSSLPPTPPPFLLPISPASPYSAVPPPPPSFPPSSLPRSNPYSLSFLFQFLPLILSFSSASSFFITFSTSLASLFLLYLPF